MKMNEGLDEGPIIASQEITINSETNGQTLRPDQSWFLFFTLQ